MHCPRCGSENIGGARFCTKCGGPLGDQSQPVTRETVQNSPGQAPAPATPSSPSVQNDGTAVASLVLGILSLICFGILTAIPAIITGHISLGKIKRSGDTLGGKGMAIAGLVMGYITIALTAMAALMFMEFFQQIRPKLGF